MQNYSIVIATSAPQRVHARRHIKSSGSSSTAVAAQAAAFVGATLARPPSTWSVAPVTKELLGCSRYSNAAATSEASPMRPSACMRSDRSSASLLSVMRFVIGVRICAEM